MRFDNKYTTFNYAISTILASTYLAGNLSNGAASSSIEEFSILKHFRVCIHAGRAPSIKEVLWSAPPIHEMKCNSDGASRRSPGWSACRGIFRDNRAVIVGCYAANLGLSFSFHAELMEL